MNKFKNKQFTKMSCLLLILIVASLISVLTNALIPDEITSQGACIVVTPDDGGKLTDKKLDLSGMMTTSSTSIRLDWAGCTATAEQALVMGVFIFTDESQTNTGTLRFYVGNDKGEQECPGDKYGVGVNAKGGVFNCGLAGTWFEVRCDPAAEACPSILAIL